ncbi:MAG: hypothetical protein J6B74_03810 [Ruminococcus sp.]|nr:hypothetical protein [Ruminococcus sp.]
MIKGVNKKIIEVNHTDSIYFEKAVFYLRPNVRELPTEVSRAEAEKYVSRLGLEYRMKNRRTKKILILSVTVILAVSALIVFIL